MFYWTPLSINYLIEVILIALVMSYFGVKMFTPLPSAHDRRITRLSFLVFASAFPALLLQFLAKTLHPDTGEQFFPWVGPFGAVSVASYLLFAWYFQTGSDWHRRLGYGLILALIVFVVRETLIAIERTELQAAGINPERCTFSQIPIAMWLLAAFPIFFYHMMKVIKAAGRTTWLRAFGASLAALVHPTRRVPQRAGAARAYFYVTFSPVWIGLSVFLHHKGLISWPVSLTLSCWAFLFSIASFVLVYISYYPEQSSIRIKIIGITLTTVLGITCGISWLIGDVYSASFNRSDRIEAGQAIRFTPARNTAYEAKRIPYDPELVTGERIDLSPANAPKKGPESVPESVPENIPENCKKDRAKNGVPLPFRFPFYGEKVAKVYPSLSGMLGMQSTPIPQDVKFRYGPQPAILFLSMKLEASDKIRSGLFLSEFDDHVTFTWRDLITSLGEGHGTVSGQLKLFRSGAIEMHVISLPPDLQHHTVDAFDAPMATGLVPPLANRTMTQASLIAPPPAFGQSIHGAPASGLIEDHRMNYLRYLDQVYNPIANFILIATLLILILMPRFFQINLDRPFQELLQGVRQIRNGELATSIKRRNRDEIGYLAVSFNEMAAAQHNLISTLEDKVERRTREAAAYAAQNARLEERNHLARELHDAVSQALFSANLIADTLPDLRRQNPQKAQEALSEVKRLNQTALVEMRQLLIELRPSSQPRAPFSQLLRPLLLDIERNFAVKIACTVESDVALPGDIQLTFSRIAQECVTNAAKHAKAEKISVYFDAMEGQALLTVKDDGIGFDTGKTYPGHLGLQIMAERIATIGGTLDVESSIGKGTTITTVWFEHGEE